ncbi:MAG TPA: DUF86 domain-containing protein [Nitrospiraceae bacterium]|jgi:uncharacterized protein YutE (UPF0331/DUF86 family)|nr:DUF86 domain-containing protein [Nitrospiraceae bacterium]
MSPLDEAIVRKKLTVIVQNLKALEPIRRMTRQEYLDDLYKRKAAERLLQELIEAAIDINAHIITQTGNVVPDNYYESFTLLGDLKVISHDLARNIAPSAGLRNRLVHEYDLIDHDLVLDAIGLAENLYAQYVKEIESFITGSK